MRESAISHLAIEIADVLDSSYDSWAFLYLELWRQSAQKDAKFADLVSTQLETPSGRESLTKALKNVFDDDAIEGSELKNLVGRIQAIGPISGFPLGNTITGHGFSVTDFACMVLDDDELEALGSVVREILAEFGYKGDELESLVQSALNSRIGDISCFDAAGYINFLREHDHKEVGGRATNRADLSPILDGAKAAQKNRPKVGHDGSGPKQ